MATGDTKFEELTIPELKGVADTFGVDLDGKTKKSDIIAEIKEFGVNWQMYADLVREAEENREEVLDPEPELVESVDPLAEDEDEEEEETEMILLKMTRVNFTYHVRGYKFSREHPYALVTEEDADYLIEKDGGFRMASPRELREYYGN